MKEYPERVQRLIERVFDECNLEGEDTDIYNHMYKRKTLYLLPVEEQEEIYEYLAERLGFCR